MHSAYRDSPDEKPFLQAAGCRDALPLCEGKLELPSCATSSAFKLQPGSGNGAMTMGDGETAGKPHGMEIGRNTRFSGDLSE